MIEDLFVVLGAGASFDCAKPPFVRNDSWRPPLVRELFDGRFQGILRNYPFAQAAAADIVPLLGDGTFQIERHIATEYRAGTDERAKRKYLALPLYLQEVLHTCAQEFAWSPDAYDRLLTGLSELPHVTYVTLNYDTLLDDRLATAKPRENMDWYVDPASEWSLIKLHGSVDWGYQVPVAGDFDLGNPPSDLRDRLSSNIELRAARTELAEIRLRPGPFVENRLFSYPAISVPVGEADELVCPPAHVQVLEQRLVRAQPVHLLVIGYSGLDQEVIQLLLRREIRVASLTVVDVGEAADQAIQRIAGALRVGPRDLQFHGVHRDGFYAFTNGGLSEYAAMVRSRAF